MSSLEPQKRYIEKNKSKLGCSFDKELLQEFKQACKILNVDQTPIIVECMQETIKKAKKKQEKL